MQSLVAGPKQLEIRIEAIGVLHRKLQGPEETATGPRLARNFVWVWVMRAGISLYDWMNAFAVIAAVISWVGARTKGLPWRSVKVYIDGLNISRRPDSLQTEAGTIAGNSIRAQPCLGEVPIQHFFEVAQNLEAQGKVGVSPAPMAMTIPVCSMNGVLLAAWATYEVSRHRDEELGAFHGLS